MNGYPIGERADKLNPMRLIWLGLLSLMTLRVDAVEIGIGNSEIRNFREAKKHLPLIHAERGLTLYCRCQYSGKKINQESCKYRSAQGTSRASRIEWEHVVPAEAFGWSFQEWRVGSEQCRRRNKKYKGRKCAQKNPQFNFMEADLYNLFPEVGEVNGLRSNYSMAEVGALGQFTGVSFGGCQAKIFQSKFEPMDFAKGTVARAYLYMDQAYPGRGIISDKNQKLFQAWDKLHPIEAWECDLYQKIKKVQKNDNPILRERCLSVNLKPNL
jgi:deoxyribonuclease-1